ncbi:DnaJ domain-containing protein, partial [Piptocephalis cylindrospora]
YKILGLDPTSTHTQLKGSFYQLTRVHHPDTPGGGDKEKFREVVDAWRFLSDPQRRRVYDE